MNLRKRLENKIGGFFVKSLYEVGLDEAEVFAREIRNEALEEAAKLSADNGPEECSCSYKIRMLKDDNAEQMED